MLSAAPDHCFGKRGGRTMLTPLEIATGYLARGWNPVPVHYRKKNPIENEWQKLIITESNIATYFNGAKLNVGVQLGPNSNGLTDIDLDCDEAIHLAHHFLPKTPAMFGRKSKPTSHLLYTIDDAPADKAVLKLTDKIGRDAKGVVEL
jgi:bifunctional DNA primase/polymerase-like protein